MTMFNRKDFNTGGEYLTYGADRRFVARFKYRGTPMTKAKFITALVRHYSIEEFFARTERRNGQPGTAPLRVLLDDGVITMNETTKKFDVRK